MLVTRHELFTGEYRREVSPFFCDWISIYQDHGCSLPVVNDGVVMAVDEEGELRWKTCRPTAVAGSFSTQVQVRSDGNGYVSFSGNVSRFGRPHNLFGFDLGECLRRVNEILAGYGLPPFTRGMEIPRLVRMPGRWSNTDRSRSMQVKLEWTGARITRLDLTQNFGTGSLSDARAYMEWLSTQQHTARIKVGTHFDGETVDWGRGSRRVYSKAYLKSAELARHGAPAEAVRYCEDRGVIRFEVTLKSTQLIDMGCQFLGSLDMEQLELIFAERREVMTRAEHTHDDFENLPNHLRRTARDWLAGDDMRTRMSQPTFSRHRRELLRYGIDIAVKRNVVEFKPRVRVIEVRPLTQSDFQDFLYEQRKAA